MPAVSSRFGSLVESVSEDISDDGKLYRLALDYKALYDMGLERANHRVYTYNM